MKIAQAGARFSKSISTFIARWRSLASSKASRALAIGVENQAAIDTAGRADELQIARRTASAVQRDA